MPSYCSNSAVMQQKVKKIEVYLYFICQPASQLACHITWLHYMYMQAPKFLHIKDNDIRFMKLLF